ncbi:hypothetical protein E7T06_16025 [Deinococcus sp. Arct2-2]|uniref:hypothetical protein n=1 Tax=Deinococcus sp. Arct2-2 TaxID=2568653 RepID=UPI0010A39452|nr:hypothetical protein [Deinococcus sp. Arct2-2]THF68523.1 hypothetical protein E7T06_16025 [Deinococcus sp. Arct2-2]
MLDQTHRFSPAPFTEVDVTQLLQRICVRPPYFALDTLRLEGDLFRATAVAQRHMSNEAGAMQACEISRHAAICGLCAAALAFNDDDRRYYLARDAVYTGYANPTPYGATVSFEARVVEQNKRHATAEITVTAGGADLAFLRVTYTILGDSSFKRLFRSKYSTGFTALAGDRMPDPPTGQFSSAGQTEVLTLDKVPEEACAGHFEHYPAMPVAVLMGQLGLVAGRLHGTPYRVEAATMTAMDFCWAGESARFEVTPLTALGAYSCTAYASDEVVSEMSLNLAPVE